MRAPLRYARDAAVFAPCYLLLDWVSYIDPLGPFNITPWNPQPALAIAWMLLGGLIHAPSVFATVLLADLIVRGAPGGYALITLTALVLTLGYTGAAWMLRRLLRPEPRLDRVRHLTLFVVVVVPMSAAISAAFVGVLFASGSLNEDALAAGWLRFWVGDAVGIIVTAPLLLVVADAERRARLVEIGRRPETYLQIAVLGLSLWLIFEVLRGDPAHHFYLLFLPLIWIAVRSGMAGAIVAVALIQAGVVLAIHHHPNDTLPMLDLQVLVASLTMTGLYLGVMVDERERANAGLRQSLRLAAAGEMAGAITHEVNQPLTAVTNYGRSALKLADAGRTAELRDVVEKMLRECNRAAEVVRRLRDFFKAGTTRLESVRLEELLAGAAAAAEAMDSRVRVSVDVAEPATLVLIDRVQIDLVFRNLVANAVDAVKTLPAEARSISLHAARPRADFVALSVCDNGPGVKPGDRDRVFEPFVSGKPTGLGLGLAVSRAIAEAHGGSLTARIAQHGEFLLTLPVTTDHG
ncbi:MAG TPA: MASE1 domain-containing protein [Burkholderiales bacterium]|nr:MASE1 domain-containing protein [Burkholderiales bacterium]